MLVNPISRSQKDENPLDGSPIGENLINGSPIDGNRIGERSQEAMIDIIGKEAQGEE
jgi:hypothetical protein